MNISKSLKIWLLAILLIIAGVDSRAQRREVGFSLGGVYYTGDMAYKDEEGYFYLTARLREIIKVGGRRISPKEIEEVIVSIPGVIDCSISGIFDEILGEALKAEIVVSDINDPSADESVFKRLCAEKLAPEKVPQVIQFSSRLEVAPTGKKIKKLEAT